MTMRIRLWKALIVALFAVAAVAATALAAAVPIYSNDMSSIAERGQLRKASGRNCDRGGSEVALRVDVGRRTAACIYRTPVIGRDLEIFSTERLLSGTPASIRGRIYLGLGLRTGGGGGYLLQVFPVRRTWQLRREEPGAGGGSVLASGNSRRIEGVDDANRLGLRAFNLTRSSDPDDCRLVATVNGERLAVATDPGAGPLRGRFSTASVGAARNANGAVASFDDVLVRVPDPFGG
jgi:hypothetical protein